VIGAHVVPGQTTKELFFAGLIDEVKIYNRALTASEVQADFLACNTDQAQQQIQNLQSQVTTLSEGGD